MSGNPHVYITNKIPLNSKHENSKRLQVPRFSQQFVISDTTKINTFDGNEREAKTR